MRSQRALQRQRLLAVAVLVGLTAFSLHAQEGAETSDVATAPAPSEPGDGTYAWSFSEDPLGQAPRGWVATETGGAGRLAQWSVVADGTAPGPPNAVAVESGNSGSTFNLLVARNSYLIDLDLTASLKAVSGEEDQGGGVAWRLQDSQNYYVARWNPLENNLRVYVVRDGRRKMLASTDAPADAAAWHTLRIQMVGSSITVSLDDKHFLETQDASLAGGGMVGLWTKADADTLFDEVKANPPGSDSD
jgi:hypothetical protein